MKIAGTGSALPTKQVTNDDLSKFLDTSDEWIFPRTGIKSRHVISDENLEDLAVEAVNKALEMASVAACDIDFFICSNVVNEYITPGLGCVIASKAGLTCPSIDINCGCPGFVYGMDIIDKYFRSGTVKNVLMVAAEEPSRMTAWTDRSTCVLFGDGAAAAVFTEGDNYLASKLSARPDPDPLYQYHLMEPTPYVTKEEYSLPLQMKGREVFKFAITACLDDIKTVLDKAGKKVEDIDYFLIHQANQRIVDSIRGHLGVEEAKFPTNIIDHGNSSSASCLILLDECNRKGMFKRGDLLLFSGFGAGLLSGSALLEW